MFAGVYYLNRGTSTDLARKKFGASSFIVCVHSKVFPIALMSRRGSKYQP